MSLLSPSPWAAAASCSAPLCASLPPVLRFCRPAAAASVSASPTTSSSASPSSSRTPRPPPPSPRSSIAPDVAGEVGGRVVVAREDGEAEVFDPEERRWAPAALRGGEVRRRSGRGQVYVTERWATDSWEEMARGMREGWTGSCAVSGGRMYIVAEYGEWRLRRPHIVAGEVDEVGGGRRRTYVVGVGLDVAIGTVSAAPSIHSEDERVDSEVVKGAAEFTGLVPCNAQVLYA